MIVIDKTLVEAISEKAAGSSRKRMNHNFHIEDGDLLQRLLNAMEPGTYVRPHKHENPDKREVFLIVKGTIALIIFDDRGDIIHIFVLNKEKGNYGVEIPARTWHMLVSLEENSVIYELKDGPYNAADDKTFASWAPEEGAPDTEKYLDKIFKTIIKNEQ